MLSYFLVGVKMKSEALNTEISYIKDERLKENLVTLLNLLPDYFYEIPASSTGKYHPEFSLGNGGLVRHTKVACKIANTLFGNESVQNFTDYEKDLLLMAIMLHDGVKCGIVKSEYTSFDHPILMANFIKENSDRLTLKESEIDFICDAIKTHMGQWTKDYRGNEVLEKPVSKYQRFVHMCDYLSAQKFLNVKFNENEICI